MTVPKSSEQTITKEQFILLRQLALLCEDDVTQPVSLYRAAMLAKMDKVKAQHVAMALMQIGLLGNLQSDMNICVTEEGVLYCEHRRGSVVRRFWDSHNEAIIRGLIGAMGAITGSIVTLLVRHWVFGMR